MKKLILRPMPGSGVKLGGLYSTCRTVHFSFCSRPNSEGTVRFSGSPEYCRETIICSFRDYINHINGIYGWKADLDYSTESNGEIAKIEDLAPADRRRFEEWLKKTAMETKEARLMAYFKTNQVGRAGRKISRDFYDSMISARNFLNNIENGKKGWKKTTVRRMERYRQPNGESIFMIRGSYHWIKAPHMLSLYMLLFRFFTNPQVHGVETFDELEDKVQEMRRSYDSYGGDDIESFDYVLDYVKDMEFFLEHEDELYDGRTMFDNYYYGNHDEEDVGEEEGIIALLDGESVMPEIREKWQEICRRERRR